MKKTFDFIEGFSIFLVEAEAQKSSEGRRFSEGAKTFAATLILAADRNSVHRQKLYHEVEIFFFFSL